MNRGVRARAVFGGPVEHGFASSSFLGAARPGDARRWLGTTLGGRRAPARRCGRDPALLIAKKTRFLTDADSAQGRPYEYRDAIGPQRRNCPRPGHLDVKLARRVTPPILVVRMERVC